MGRKEMCVSPEVEVLEVVAEQGFAATGGEDYTEPPLEV